MPHSPFYAKLLAEADASARKPRAPRLPSRAPDPVSNAPTHLACMSLRQIAYLIEGSWASVNYAARPYLDAMKELDTVSDHYYNDSAASIVRYFLSNARGWRGPTAKAVKAELNRRLG